MRLTIQHETRYRYETPPRSVIDVLRLTPCASAFQAVRDWRIDVTGDVPLRRFDDAFGNITHTFSSDQVKDELVITAVGTVETQTSDGVVSGTREPLPVGVFQRETPLTTLTPALKAFGTDAAAASDGTELSLAHALNAHVHKSITFEPGTTGVATAADDALEEGKGVCQDLAHILITIARAHGLPARYVSGYQHSDDHARDAHAGHAWTEIHIKDLGWVGFDPSAGLSPSDAYVRVAVGLDYLGASPVRGAIYGGGGEELHVAVTVDRAQWGQQRQSTGGQSQSMQ
ncbi:MAG: transglutaminase family protein [Pseudomonadota bacterium]